MSELTQLKSQLRSLVVSSPTAVDARALLRDYRSLVGAPLPAARHGYRDPVQFLRERCGDCFLFQGPPSNPVLTLIVPDQLRHIDEFVQRQKLPSTKSFRVKRRSIPETYIHPPRTNLIKETFVPPKHVIREDINHNSVAQPKKPIAQTVPEEKVVPVESVKSSSPDKENIECSYEHKEGWVRSESEHVETEGVYSRKRLQRFLERRMPLHQAQLARAASADSLPPADRAGDHDDDSGRQTASSGSGSGKQAALERLREDVCRLVAERPDGLWATQLMRLYEERFGRALNYERLGFASIAACACACAAGRLSCVRSPGGDWQLRAEPGPPPRPRRLPRAPPPPAPADPDDALPGVDYDPDVFPADCLSFVESIPAASVDGIAPGDMLDLVVGEVYSPSHLWVLLLGPGYDQMEDIMDEMNEYFTKGEGVDRVLAAGARRPGQYCSSAFEGDWHRSLIVQLVDSDTVKVRHVDYGTVDTVSAASLRPLRRAWAALPARALRARLAALRPPAAGRRWPRAAAAHCLRLVRDRRLVGNVVAVDHQEGIVEMLLIDTSTDEDVSITDEMVRAGHAAPRAGAALGAPEPYLLPRFAALEAGATPTYAEIHALLRDGISLHYVDAYRRHVSPERAAPFKPTATASPTFTPNTVNAPVYSPKSLSAQIAPHVRASQTLTSNHFPVKTLIPNPVSDRIAFNVAATQTFASNVSDQTFTPNAVLNRSTSNVGTQSTQTLEPNHIPVQTFTPNTGADHTFIPNTVANQTLTPTTDAVQISKPTSSPNVGVSQTFVPNNIQVQTFTPNTVTSPTPNMVSNQTKPTANTVQKCTPTSATNVKTAQTFASNTPVPAVTPNAVANLSAPNVGASPTFEANNTPVQTLSWWKETGAGNTTPYTVGNETSTPTTQRCTPASKEEIPTSSTVAVQTSPPRTVSAQMSAPHTVSVQMSAPPTVSAQMSAPHTVSVQMSAPHTVSAQMSAAPCGPPARHPATFYAVPQGFLPCPFPFAPRFAHPPAFYPRPAEARLTADECEVFELLSLVDMHAAHRYVSRALRRAPLNPLAPEFRAGRPPPGFEHYCAPPGPPQGPPRR